MPCWKALCALTAVWALTGGISGQAAFSNILDEVIVTAEKDQVEAKVLPGGFEREETSFGLTGEQDIMTVPYTAQSISAKSIEMMAAPTGQIGQVLTNVPSIRTGTSLIKTDFSMRAVIYPDGRIVIVIKGDERKLKYGLLIYNLFEEDKEPNIISPFETNIQVLLYQPEGNSMLGIFKYAGTKDDYSFTPKTAKENDKLELYVGIYLNKNGEKVGEKCMQYNSFAQAYNAEVKAGQIAKKKTQDAARNKHAQIEKVLVQKYGRKAFDAMENFRPYIGMPEGIVREYKLVMQDVNFIAYGFVRVEKGYKVYLPTRLFATTASYINARFPRAIYTRNGKVAAVKW